MATVQMVEEQEATGRVEEIYGEIKESLGTDFVPNLYKTMAAKPSYLEAQWNKTRTVMESDKLDSLTKEIIAVSVSSVMGCEY